MSSGVAAWIAHLAFWMLVPYGWFWEELRGAGVAVFLTLWAAGFFLLPLISPLGAALFPSYVALLDIALVFIIFKGDIRLG
jgi:hypothetical protein